MQIGSAIYVQTQKNGFDLLGDAVIVGAGVTTPIKDIQYFENGGKTIIIIRWGQLTMLLLHPAIKNIIVVSTVFCTRIQITYVDDDGGGGGGGGWYGFHD